MWRMIRWFCFWGLAYEVRRIDSRCKKLFGLQNYAQVETELSKYSEFFNDYKPHGTHNLAGMSAQTRIDYLYFLTLLSVRRVRGEIVSFRLMVMKSLESLFKGVQPHL